MAIVFVQPTADSIKLKKGKTKWQIISTHYLLESN